MGVVLVQHRMRLLHQHQLLLLLQHVSQTSRGSWNGIDRDGRCYWRYYFEAVGSTKEARQRDPGLSLLQPTFRDCGRPTQECF